MSKMFNNYIGKAGQLFAMSEFLMRGWNVAIPEVDRAKIFLSCRTKTEPCAGFR